MTNTPTITDNKTGEFDNVSMVTSAHLREEINQIEDKLKNLNVEDLDERSDTLSQMKSHHGLKSQSSFIESKILLAKPNKLQRMITSKSYKSKNVEIIEENADDDDLSEGRAVEELQKDIENKTEVARPLQKRITSVGENSH